MAKKMDLVLNDVLEKITVDKEMYCYMQNELDLVLEKINKRMKKLNIDSQAFVGGSFAKGTLIKKEEYDVDLFLRFDKKYSEKELTSFTKKILKKIKNVSVVHGSRIYFQIKISPNFKIEVVPVKKVENPLDSNNITDLSYSHVNYINKNVKSKKVRNEIKLAKAFCSGTKTYGAESYVHGFSGYALELLVAHYGSFEKMLKELIKKRNSKLIVDPEKKYKNKNEILLQMNGSKLLSPVILIDPTFKERNALAALNDETFERFKESAKDFFKKPDIKFFFPKKINLCEIKEKAQKDRYEFIEIETKTKKQPGDIAGTKLLKFHNHLKSEISKYFFIKNEGFNYDKQRKGHGFFIVKKKKEFIFSGPKQNDKKNKEKFEKEHQNIFIKDYRLYAKQEINFTIKEFMKKWKKKNKKKIKQMYISKINFF